MKNNDSHLSVSHLSVCLSGDTVGFAVPRRSGGYVAGVGRSIVAVDWSTETMTSLVEVDEDKLNNRLNDGKVDPIGRLLAGQSGYLSALPVYLKQCCYGNSVRCLRYDGEGGATCGG